FFQAEDGIRDRNVTGVQTCALPISPLLPHSCDESPESVRDWPTTSLPTASHTARSVAGASCTTCPASGRKPSNNVRASSASPERSEERRVGKEGRCGGAQKRGR